MERKGSEGRGAEGKRRGARGREGEEGREEERDEEAEERESGGERVWRERCGGGSGGERNFSDISYTPSYTLIYLHIPSYTPIYLYIHPNALIYFHIPYILENLQHKNANNSRPRTPPKIRILPKASYLFSRSSGTLNGGPH